MSARGLAWLFALALPPLLVLLLPLRLALGAMQPERTGLGAAAVCGSLWRGRLHDARLHGRTLGDVEVGLSPWSLLGGTRALWLRSATLEASLLQGARHGIRGASGTLVLEAPGAAPGLVATLEADGATVLFEGDACRTAAGRVRLALHGADGAPLAVLDGPLACDGRAATVTWGASGAASEGLAGLRIDGRIESDGAWRLRSVVPGVDDAGAAAALGVAGFRPGPGGWSRVDSGRLVAVATHE
ncbi:type II secretion system protein N [Luteimonas sp. RD2P54]|uniref:Type II secretion system protein N n=1 Tax=Luteimonas endophytica TaxID=3042023 RepID=A0ABT6JBF8_9GAMM|nr:type II secretion system protein N [Luteimonas endophytica]MDH5824136.1 type II secretion system protein N [Luteimonas endophytica]